MRYFVPDIRVAQEAPNCIERLGGLPWGLPKARWPRCSGCGRSQSLLAQFQHDANRLDLGRGGRTLFAFQCNCDPGMCDTWEAFSGANACFVLEPDDLQNGETPLPPDTPPIDPAVRVIGWMERDDGLPDTLKAHFQSDAKHLALDEEIHNKVTWGTRIGGAPKWIQSAEEAPRDGWQFVAQLDSSYSFHAAPRDAHSWVEPDATGYEGRTHRAEGPNFGFGLGYILLRPRGSDVPEGCFFWQR
jgi:hypothetical protein